MCRTLLPLFLLLVSFVAYSQQPMMAKPKKPIICYALPANQNSVVEPPEKYKQWLRQTVGRTKTAHFEVTYIGFTPQAQAAFQEAVDIWETMITSPVTIRVTANWTALGAGVLGSAIWGTVHANFPGAQRVNTWYPAALAEKMAGVELNDDTDPDIFANFSSSVNWYYGTGSSANKYDLTTVVLHELGHGLGFVDSYTVEGTVGKVGVQDTGVPMIYDQQLENLAGQNLFHDFTTSTADLKTQLTSNNVYYNSSRLGARARIYAPATYDGGSSISHLNETTYGTGDPNSLMTPQIGMNEIIHDPGAVMLGMFSDMGWVFTYINHDPLKDRENVAGPYEVKAVVTSEAGSVQAGSVKLHYTTGGAVTEVVMTATGNPNEYSASIPGTGSATTYGYFITATDNFDREYSRPGKLIAPGVAEEQFFLSFSTGPDNKKPRITHSPKAFILDTDTQFLIEAIISDNLGIASAKIQYLINDVPKTDITMTSGVPDSLYSGTINLGAGGLTVGDVIKYRITAIDNSVAHNSQTSPATLYYEVNVTGLAATEDSYSNDFNTTSSDFFGDFTIATPAGFTSGAINSPHPYTEGNGFPNNQINLVYQLRIPIRVRASDATVKFDEVVLIEPGESGAVFGDEDFFDYVVVEGSKDGGTTWIPLDDGYDSRDYTPWLTKYNSATSGNNSTAVGDPGLYRTRTISLLDEFVAGDEVSIRFRLFSDPFAVGWGWIIDNLKIQIDDTAPLVLNDHIDFLAPDATVLPISTKVTDASGVKDLVIEYQLNEQALETFEFAVTPETELYTLNLNLPALSAGDEIKYRIVAHDNADNTGTFPPDGGFITVSIFEPDEPVSEYHNNFNAASDDFIGNFFTVSTPDGFSNGAIHSSHFYPNGIGLDKTSDFSYILTKPVIIDASSHNITFNEVVIVQGHSSGAAYGTAAFNDYVVVEGSKDGGATWTHFQNGYDAVGQSTWLNAFTNGTNGTSSLYRKRTINMLNTASFSANDEVLIRFRMYANTTLNGWGWAIDDLDIQSPVTGTEPIADSDVKIYPNPATTEVNVEIASARAKEVTLRIMNAQGQVVLREDISTAEPSFSKNINVRDLTSGVYIIKATLNGATVTRKFVKIN